MAKRDDPKLKSVLAELFKLRNPHLERPATEVELGLLSKKISDKTNRSKLGLPISRKAYLELVSSRNKNLIFPHEQKILRDSNLVFFGMSVGASAVLSWMMMSRANKVTIIDPDVIETTNLNRMLFGVEDIGRLKVDVLKNFLLRINPFAEVKTYSERGKNLIQKTINSEEKIKVIIDEMDDIEAKIYLRKIAKDLRIPVVSAADVGDMTMIDVERYDNDISTEPFAGKLGKLDRINFRGMTEFEKKKLIIKLVGFENNSERLLDSLMAIGGTVTTWPQLGPTAFMTGGVVALVIKKILLGENVRNGRYYISLDNLMIGDFNSKKRRSARKEKVDSIKKLLNL